MEHEGLDATAEAKWNALAQADRAAIGTQLWALYNGPFQGVIKRWPVALKNAVDWDPDAGDGALTTGTQNWHGEGHGNALHGVSDLVEVLHFAGFTLSVAAIFDAHPATFGSVERPGAPAQLDVRPWHTSIGAHHPVTTMATFR